MLYVTDMFLVGKNIGFVKEVKSQLSSKFNMKDLSVANFISRREIKRDHANSNVWVGKRNYVETILQRFNM